MAAEGGKTNKLAMHLDKIAYGTALVLGVLIVLIPVFATSELNQVIRGLPEQQRAVAEKIEQEPPPIVVPDLKKKLHDQWEVSPSRGEKWLPPWTIDARPAVVKLTKVAGKTDATHEAGKVAKVSYQRDKQKRQVFLRVEAAAGTLDKARFTKIRLLRAEVKDGAPGEFKEIAELKADKLTHDDYQVEPGKLYAYKLVTEVEIAGDPNQVDLKPENVKKESDPPLGMIAAVPYDFAIRILTATGPTGTGTPPSLTGDISYWDYETSKLVKAPTQKYAEKAAFGTKNRYAIFQIEDSKVVINDLTTRDKTPIKAGDPQRPVELPADLTPESVAEANKPKEPEPEPEKEEPKKAAPKKEEPEKKAPPKKTEGTKKPKDKDKDKPGSKPKRQVK